MTQFIIRRVFWGLVTIWVISVITFSLFFVLPTGDPAVRIAGKSATPQLIKDIRAKYKLDKDPVTQYVYQMKGLLTGKLISYNTQLPTVQLALHALPVTLSLTLFAMVIWTLAGVSAGVYCARRPGSALDKGIMGIAIAGISVPAMWLGMMMLKTFTDTWAIFPPGGYKTVAEGGIFGWAYHLALPAATLAILSAGVYSRMTRTSVKTAMGAEHVKTAIAKGLPEREVMSSHILRVGLIQIVVMLGLDFGALLGGAIFTEQIFSLPGLGQVLLLGIKNLDVPILLTSSILAATFVVIMNLIADLAQAALDPRIRLD